ncbi:hypothetical protein [uncultured Clostridium sp.]|uniref:hypothetical protein n=1 Tax=uncultured Clostridium sp. TaxID=59620 RepID=UPI002638CD30|nr:hypothetical protein [uncultured Clostridium sp.]
MSEVKIKNTTMEEFKAEFGLKGIDGVKSYSVAELGTLMGNADGKTYFVIGDKLFEEPSEELQNKEIAKEDIVEIEKLHDAYRDLLVEYREYLYYKRGDKDSEEARKIKHTMNNVILKTRELLEKNSIKLEENLREASTKFFIPDFTNDVFKVDTYNMLDEIDCGL